MYARIQFVQFVAIEGRYYITFSGMMEFLRTIARSTNPLQSWRDWKANSQRQQAGKVIGKWKVWHSLWYSDDVIDLNIRCKDWLNTAATFTLPWNINSGDIGYAREWKDEEKSEIRLDLLNSNNNSIFMICCMMLYDILLDIQLISFQHQNNSQIGGRGAVTISWAGNCMHVHIHATLLTWF